MIQLALEGQHREQRLQSMAQPVLQQLPSWERAAQDPVLVLALWDVLCWGLQGSPFCPGEQGLLWAQAAGPEWCVWAAVGQRLGNPHPEHLSLQCVPALRVTATLGHIWGLHPWEPARVAQSKDSSIQQCSLEGAAYRVYLGSPLCLIRGYNHSVVLGRTRALTSTKDSQQPQGPPGPTGLATALL